MRKMSKTLVLLMTALLVFGAANSALAGRDGKQRPPGGGDPWSVDPTANGLKLFGVLAIHYEADDESQDECIEGDFPTKMTYFMRLSTGNILLPFGSFAPGLCYYDFKSQQAVIKTYIESEVVPALIKMGLISNIDACVQFKVIRDGVDDPSNLDEPFKDPYDPQYSIVDIVLAIDDNKPCPP